MTGLDYTELDKWMKDLDVLQQELRSMQQPSSTTRGDQGKPNGSLTTQSNLTVNHHASGPQTTQRYKKNENVNHVDLSYTAKENVYSPAAMKASVTRSVTYSPADYQAVRRPLPKSELVVVHQPVGKKESPSFAPDRFTQSKSFGQLSHHTRIMPKAQPNWESYSNELLTKEPKTVHWSSDVGAKSNGPSSQPQRHKTVLNLQLGDGNIETQQSRPTTFSRSANVNLRNNPLPTRMARPFGVPSRSHSVGPIPRPKKPTESPECPFAFPISLAEFTEERNKSTPDPAKSPVTHHSSIQISPSQWLQTVQETLAPCPEPLLGLPAQFVEERPPDTVDAHYTKTYVQPSDASEKTGSNGRNSWQSNGKRKLILRVYHPDRTTKAVAIEEDMTAFDVLKTLLEKNMMRCSRKHALVEKIPSLKLERCFEDSEPVMDCLVNWQLDSENLIFFEEREDMYGMFENPHVWLGDQTVASNGPIDANHAKELFTLNNELNLPAHSEHLYVRTNETHWKRRLCLLRNSGLYVSKHNAKDISAFHRIISFKPFLHLYTTTGGWKKMQAPTPYGFLIRPYTSGNLDAHYTVFFCATSEASLRVWYSLLRLALAGLQLLKDYASRVQYANTILLESKSKSISSLSTSYDRVDMTQSVNQNVPPPPSLHRPFWPGSGSTDRPLMGSTTTMWSNAESNKELGCVSGRPDVHSSTHSVTDLEKSGSKKQSSECGNSISSLFTCSPSWTKEDRAPAGKDKRPTRSSSVSRPTTTRSLKKRLFGNGPAARRCSRSVTHISAPFDVTLPSWVQERCSRRLSHEFTETAM
ncbi:Growth factor receptor-bound protein 14 [Clonorchis sinensis]|uniref:Growth factor receptor-bound protein 14 n=1 Tax=Clonorchis sinensis TaxID=79923 RepID=A0A8T1MBB2_CLOSI|nr:Growth factor receptor-bound protein 14 [Clonorchis sinensis]